MKLLNNSIAESGKNRNFKKISGKEQMRFFFTLTEERYVKDNKN